jgi:hypothetical protein
MITTSVKEKQRRSMTQNQHGQIATGNDMNKKKLFFFSVYDKIREQIAERKTLGSPLSFVSTQETGRPNRG